MKLSLKKIYFLTLYLSNLSCFLDFKAHAQTEEKKTQHEYFDKDRLNADFFDHKPPPEFNSQNLPTPTQQLKVSPPTNTPTEEEANEQVQEQTDPNLKKQILDQAGADPAMQDFLQKTRELKQQLGVETQESNSLPQPAKKQKIDPNSNDSYRF
jgi:hypothetical protein